MDEVEYQTIHRKHIECVASLYHVKLVYHVAAKKDKRQAWNVKATWRRRGPSNIDLSCEMTGMTFFDSQSILARRHVI
jgi:hypothetical protein